ncbi:aspartate 1-decarboxylase [Candidatus Micrarchaeota archaeon]|nr:aspartate 1-decarboxylase [Candidatus Micrarchaeota archaeon]
MMRSILKSKIHRAVVTGTNKDYIGSIAIDEALLAAVDILPNERVLVTNLNNGKRFETYAFPARMQGEIILSGPNARLGEVGDTIVIMAFALAEDSEIPKPKIVFVDEKNRVIRRL